METTRRSEADAAAGDLRRSGGLVLRGGPIPGQELVDALGRVGGEPREDVAQPCLGVETIELGGLGQRVDGGGALAAIVGTCEQPILAAEGDGADCPLGCVVVDLDAAVVAVAGELRPSAEGI